MVPSHAPSQKCLRDARRNSAASRLGSDRSACRRVSAALPPHWPALSGPAARTTPPLFDTATHPSSYVLSQLLLTGLPHLFPVKQPRSQRIHHAGGGENARRQRARR